jgi:hypothetical protein
MKTQDAIVLPSIILFFGGLTWYFRYELMGEDPPPPNYEDELKGGKKTSKYRRNKKCKNTKRK